MNKQARFHIGYWVAAIIALGVGQYFYSTAQRIASIPYSQFQQLLHDGKVAEIGVSDRYIQGKLKEPLADGKSQFVTTRVDPQLADELKKYGVTYTGQVESTFLQDLLSWVVPVLLFFGLWTFLARRMSQGLGGGLMSIGKSKAKIYVESDTGVRFDDVAGVDKAKDELREIVEFLKDPMQYSRLGGRMPKGVLLVGPPGTGKTLLARAVAGQAKVPFFSISGSEFVEMFVGVGAARVRDLFEQAREKAPAIIFIDELDALGRARGSRRPRRKGADAQSAARRDGRFRFEDRSGDHRGHEPSGDSRSGAAARRPFRSSGSGRSAGQEGTHRYPARPSQARQARARCGSGKNCSAHTGIHRCRPRQPGERGDADCDPARRRCGRDGRLHQCGRADRGRARKTQQPAQ